MKVIFLNFDGVINCIGFKILVEPAYVERLKEIIKRTDAKVVVTSFRKNEFLESDGIIHEKSICYKYYEKHLINLGVEIFDYTPFINVEDRNTKRELEISEYLRLHPEIEAFVIIEDDYVIKNI